MSNTNQSPRSLDPPSSSSPKVGPKTFWRDAKTPFARRIAWVALGGDLAFGLIRLVQLFSSDLKDIRLLRLDVDGSLPEFVQYTKFLFLAGLMVFLAFATKARWYYIWAVSFLFLMLDDALMIHERIGEFYAPRISSWLPAGTDTGAVAEFGYFAIVGVVIGGLALAGMYRSPGNFRRFSFDMILLLGLGAFFAVAVDLIHGLLNEPSFAVNNLFAITEDGGEMVVVSIIVVYATMVAGHHGQLSSWLSDVRRLRD